MFYVKRALLIGWLVCGLIGTAYAFTFSYGDAFSVSGIEQDSGQLVLPLSSKKYRDVKLTSKKLYQFLKQCQSDCTYPVKQTVFVCTDFHYAFSNENILIADVEFNKEIIVTFLVMKQSDQIRVQLPKEVVFKDTALWQQVQEELKNLI